MHQIIRSEKHCGVFGRMGLILGIRSISGNQLHHYNYFN